jgi:hypothetical protein
LRMESPINVETDSVANGITNLVLKLTACEWIANLMANSDLFVCKMLENLKFSLCQNLENLDFSGLLTIILCEKNTPHIKTFTSQFFFSIFAHPPNHHHLHGLT